MESLSVILLSIHSDNRHRSVLDGSLLARLRNGFVISYEQKIEYLVDLVKNVSLQDEVYLGTVGKTEATEVSCLVREFLETMAKSKTWRTR